MRYSPDPIEEKKRAEETFRKIEAELTARPELRAELSPLVARLKEILREAEALMDAMCREGEPLAVPLFEESAARLLALGDEEERTWQELESKMPQDFMEKLWQY